MAKDQFGVADTLAVDSDAVEYLRRLPEIDITDEALVVQFEDLAADANFRGVEPAVFEVKLVDTLPRWIGQ